MKKKFDTYNTGTEKVKQMENNLREMKELANIQFDFRGSQFQHFTVNQIHEVLEVLEYLISELKKDLEQVKEEKVE